MNGTADSAGRLELADTYVPALRRAAATRWQDEDKAAVLTPSKPLAVRRGHERPPAPGLLCPGHAQGRTMQ